MRCALLDDGLYGIRFPNWVFFRWPYFQEPALGKFFLSEITPPDYEFLVIV